MSIIIVWTSPPWISRLAILMARWWLLGLLGMVWATCNMVRRWWLLCRAIRREGVSISWHCRLLRRWRLVIRCLGPRRMSHVHRICLLLRSGSLSLMGLTHRRVVVSTSVLTILETETCHLSLYIFNHFSALDVSGHHKIAALLLYVCDCILFNKRRHLIYCLILSGKTQEFV